MVLDLQVPEDIKEISNILTEVRYLIKGVILEELQKNSDEIKKLRNVTWPVCQSLRENSQIADIAYKIKFLNDLDYNEIIDLKNEKSKFSSSNTLKLSTSHLKREELNMIGLN
jgi:hypothetical protein